MRRRAFLRRTGVLLGAVPTAGVLGFDSPVEVHSDVDVGPWAFDPTDWDEVRDQFALTRDRIHMATFLLASHPRPVAEAIRRHRTAFDEDPAAHWEEHFQQAEPSVREAAAEYLSTDPGLIALTDSTTMGLGLVYGGLRLGADQEVLTTPHGHYATLESLRLRAERTRVLAVTWVHSSTGVKLPLAAMAEALDEVNAGRDVGDRVLFCVDGVHGLGIEDVTMDELGCDFFIAGTHKWLHGPRGTGLICGREHAWEAVEPIIPTLGPTVGVWIGALPPDTPLVTPGSYHTPGGFHSFEHRWALGEAFRFHEEIGKSRIQERVHSLNSLAKQALADVAHARPAPYADEPRALRRDHLLRGRGPHAGGGRRGAERGRHRREHEPVPRLLCPTRPEHRQRRRGGRALGGGRCGAGLSRRSRLRRGASDPASRALGLEPDLTRARSGPAS